MLSVSQPGSWYGSWSVVWLFGWSVGQSFVSLLAQSVDWSVSRQDGLRVVLLVSRSVVGCLNVWLFGWSVG